MKVLIVWYDIPDPYNPSSARPFHFIKHSKEYHHDITLITFKRSTEKSSYKCALDLQKYCDKVETIDISKELKTFKKRIINTLKNRFLFQNFLSRDFYVFNYVYYPKMRSKIVNSLKSNNFDVIYVERSMLFYFLNINTNSAVILDFVDPMLYSSYQRLQHEKKISKKLMVLFRYHCLKLFEVSKYKKFDAGVYVSSINRNLLKPYLPKRTFIVPYGVDLGYFEPDSVKTCFSSLVFTGDMSYFFNVGSIINFCEEIFPLIRKAIPSVKLYVAGKNPTKEIKLLTSRDESIIVTGYVKEIKPYIAHASVVIAPMTLDDGGFKTKILEAMAMGKPVVSTSIGARGLSVTSDMNILIADDPKEFARRVIELLNDEGLRNRIGANARKLVEGKYSWEKMTDKLNDVFQGVVNKR